MTESARAQSTSQLRESRSRGSCASRVCDATTAPLLCYRSVEFAKLCAWETSHRAPASIPSLVQLQARTRGSVGAASMEGALWRRRRESHHVRQLAGCTRILPSPRPRNPKLDSISSERRAPCDPEHPERAVVIMGQSCAQPLHGPIKLVPGETDRQVLFIGQQEDGHPTKLLMGTHGL